MLNIAGIIDNSFNNGDGIRTVVFTQGCPHHCEGCHNKHTWSFETAKLMSYKDIIKIIDHNRPIIRGVTFSGGEPMCQAKELIKVAKWVKSEAMDVWCYTGFTLVDLLKLNDKDINAFLKTIDILVEGKFEINLTRGATRYVGSTNQKIIDMKGVNINE